MLRHSASVQGFVRAGNLDRPLLALEPQFHVEAAANRVYRILLSWIKLATSSQTWQGARGTGVKRCVRVKRPKVGCLE